MTTETETSTHTPGPWIITDTLGIDYCYVESLPGWTRSKDGSFYRDGSFEGGPGWTKNIEHAYLFQTHRSAARVANLCPDAKIRDGSFYRSPSTVEARAAIRTAEEGGNR